MKDSVRRWAYVCAAIVVMMGMGRTASAQQDVATGSGDNANARIEAHEVLARLITIHLDNTPLRHAIDIVASQAKVLIGYRRELVDAGGRTVTINVVRQPLGTVLERVLMGTKLRAVVTDANVIALKPGQDAGKNAGIVTGRVINARSERPLAHVTVWLDDSGHVTRTDDKGVYHFVDVLAGRHRISVRYVGYARQVHLVTVTDDQTATVNFALESSVNTLDQVVVTATGAQRIRELGHSVAQINADSLVREAPITNVFELLQSRVPGLQIFTSSGGIAGAPASIRLRGQGSFSLSSEPIFVVDGVRIQSNDRVTQGGFESPDTRGLRSAEPASPLSLLNVNDIENVEIVKGPSASTLYGPDGANGVIVITTKKGSSGNTKWNWHAQPLFNSVPVTERLSTKFYQVWSHATDDSVTRTPLPYACTLIAQYYYKQCIIDSVVAAKSFFQQPQLSTIGPTAPSWQYGANLSGGNSAITYYLSGEYQNQLGNVQVPPEYLDLLKRQRGVSSFDEAIRHPSAMMVYGLRGSMTATPSSTMTFNASADYHQSAQRVYDPTEALNPGTQVGFPPGVSGAPTDSTTNQWILQNLSYAQLALQTQESETQHLNGSVQGDMQLLSWLRGSLVAGIDLNDQTQHDLQPSSGVYPDGNASDERRNNLSRTITLNLNASNHAGDVSFKTSTGLNYIYNKSDGVTVMSFGIQPGTSTIGTAGYTSLTPLWSETVSLGTYLQEVVGFYDQLYLDAGARLDGSTRFGEAYHPAMLPKVGVSWVASDASFLRGRLPGISELRVRSSFGVSTRYPTTGMKLGSIYPSNAQLFNQQVTTFFRGLLSNSDLRPERGREFEYGADATLFGRIVAGVSWWNRRTIDELNYIQLPGGLPAQWRNVASVGQHGFEGTIVAPVFDTRHGRADVTFTYSVHRSKVLSVGQNPASSSITGYTAGYPLDAFFATPIIDVKDTVGGGPDHVFEYQEGVYGKLQFYGVFTPPVTATVSPQVTLLRGQLRVGTVFDRQTGFVVEDRLGLFCAYAQTCPQAYDIHTPLLEQAGLISSYEGNPYFMKKGDFTRWRELNVTLDVPTRFLKLSILHLAFSGATFSIQGRNLKLWTPFTGSDPESNWEAGQYGTNRAGIPQTREWGFRFDLKP